MGDLLRFGRVLSSVLRLGGRWRLASWLGLAIAVGWFVLGIGGKSFADSGCVAYCVGTGAYVREFPIADGADPGPVTFGLDFARTVLDHGPAVWAWFAYGLFAFALVGSVVVAFFSGWWGPEWTRDGDDDSRGGDLRDSGAALRGGDGLGGVCGRPGCPCAARALVGGESRERLGA